MTELSKGLSTRTADEARRIQPSNRVHGFAFTADSRILYSNHRRPGKRLRKFLIYFPNLILFALLSGKFFVVREISRDDVNRSFSTRKKNHSMMSSNKSHRAHVSLLIMRIKISRINWATESLPSPLTAPHRTHPASVPASRPSTSPTSCPRCPCVPVWTR